MLKKSIFYLFSLLAFTNCATILNTPLQKVNINTNEDNTIYIDGEEKDDGSGNYYVLRDHQLKQITAKQEGYKDVNLAIGQYKKHWLTKVSWFPFGVLFFIPPMADIGPKAYDYEKSINVAEDMKSFPVRDSLCKEIRFNRVSVNLKPRDNRQRIFYSYSDFYHNQFFSSSRKNGKDEKVSLSNTVFVDNLNEILRSNGYIDTTHLVLKNSYLNNLQVDAEINKYTLNHVKHKNGGFYFAKLNIDYKLLNYYGDSIYSYETEATSGQYVYYYNSVREQDDRIDEAIKDAIELSMISFFEDPKVDSILHDRSQIEKEFDYEPLALSTNGFYVQSIEEATKSTVTIKGKDGHGSGFIVSKDGYIVTNYHVISDTSDLKVVLEDKKIYDFEIVRVSKIHDLALIKINADSLVPFKLNTSKNISLVQDVFAVGTPSGVDLSQSITRGVVSGIRTIETGSKLIQTDASINGGNSGGVLLNSNAEVIGIVRSKLKGFAIEGVAFGIPAYELVDKLKINNM